jgi:hypothetical protein
MKRLIVMVMVLLLPGLGCRDVPTSPKSCSTADDEVVRQGDNWNVEIWIYNEIARHCDKRVCNYVGGALTMTAVEAASRCRTEA